MATLKVVMSGQDHLTSLDDDKLSCKGDRHDFPKLRVGPLPAGVNAEPIRRTGVYQLTYTCPDCGTTRTKTTLRGGIVAQAKYEYKHPPGYLAPPGAGLSKSDYTSELGRRVAPYVRGGARSVAS
jgi:hypothetical protein